LGAEGAVEEIAPVDAAGTGVSEDPREPTSHHSPMITTNTTMAIEPRRSQ